MEKVKETGEECQCILSNAEQLELLQKIKNNEDQTAKEILITNNEKLIYFYINKYFYQYIEEQEDLFQIGNIGLIKAIDTFDLTKNIAFSTYASTCIINEIRCYLRYETKHYEVESLNRVLYKDERGNDTFLEDFVCDKTNICEDYLDKEEKVILNKIIDTLPPRDKEIIKMQFGFYNGKKYTQAEIAKKFNLNQVGVSRTLKSILEYIKEQLEDNTLNLCDEFSSLSSLYDEFPDYTMEQVNEVLSLIKDEEMQTLRLFYGEDLLGGNANIYSKTSTPSKKKDKILYKIDMKIKNPNFDISRTKFLKTIYEVCSDYSKEEVDFVLEHINDDLKEKIKLCYGDDMNAPICLINWKERQKILGNVTPKIKRYLNDPSKLEKKDKSIYRYFKDYSKEAVDSELEKLSIEQKELIGIVLNKEYDKKQYARFYTVINKIKNNLSVKYDYRYISPEENANILDSYSISKNKIKQKKK